MRQPMSARPSSARARDRRRREAEVVQRLVEQDARVVAGERPAARVGAVHAGREPDDRRARAGVAERRRPGGRNSPGFPRARRRGTARAAGSGGSSRRTRARGRLAEWRLFASGWWARTRRRLGVDDTRSLGIAAAQSRDFKPTMTAVPRLEIRSRLPARESARPPLLFVHGGYCDAWCWEPYFLPWFAAKGYAAHAVSLRGHGAQRGRRNAIYGRPRRLRGRRRMGRGAAAVAAGADRPLDGRRDHRADRREATGARRRAAGADPAGGPAVRGDPPGGAASRAP